MTLVPQVDKRDILKVLLLAEEAGAGLVTVEALGSMLSVDGVTLAVALEGMNGRWVALTQDAPGRTSVVLTAEGRAIAAEA